jgi:hypothetical protein
MEQMRIEMENMELRERLQATYATTNQHHPSNIYNTGQYINNAYIEDMPNMHHAQSMQPVPSMKQRAVPVRREGFNSAELRKLEGFNSAELRKLEGFNNAELRKPGGFNSAELRKLEGFNNAELRKMEGFNNAELRKLGRLQTMPTNFYPRLGPKCGSRKVFLFSG